MTQDIRTIRIATQGPAGPPGPASRGDVFDAASEAAMLALAAGKGDIARRTDLNQTFVLAGDDPTLLANWKLLLTPPDAVSSVAGLTGAIAASGLKSALAITAGDVSGLAASATTDTTNATNITSGTLPNARLAAVPNSALANSSVTISGHAVALGGSLALAQADVSGLTTADSPTHAGLHVTGKGTAAAPAITVGNVTTAGIYVTATRNNTVIETNSGNPLQCPTGFLTLSSGVFGCFNSTDPDASTSTIDVTFQRKAAGVWKATDYGGSTYIRLDLATVGLQGVTIANLPGTPAEGMVAFVTDGDAGFGNGQTVVNSGSGATHYFVGYKGGAWKVLV